MIKHLYEPAKRAWAWVLEVEMDRYERQDPEYIKERQAHLIEVYQEMLRRRRPEPWDPRRREWYSSFKYHLTSALMDLDEAWGYEYGTLYEFLWDQYLKEYQAMEGVVRREWMGEYNADLPYFLREEAKRILSRKFSRGPS